jgi:hypothetical protein
MMKLSMAWIKSSNALGHLAGITDLVRFLLARVFVVRQYNIEANTPGEPFGLCNG